MTYSHEDFIRIEMLNDRQEVEKEIADAYLQIDEINEAFSLLEEEMKNTPDPNLLINQIKNIESYIRKAENLLNNWDEYYYTIKPKKEISYNNINLKPKLLRGNSLLKNKLR